MWMPRYDPDAEPINAYWNAVNAGASPEELARLAEHVDPSLIDAIDRARALHRRRRPNPAFASRLERDLMQSLSATYADTVPLRPPTLRPANGRLPQPARLPRRAAIGDGRRSWLRFALPAAFVLLLLGLTGGWVLIGAPRLWPDSAPHAALPAPQLTPQATPDPATYEGILLDMVIPNAPVDPQFADIERLDYGTDASVNENCMGTANFAMLVTQGELTGTVDGPAGFFAQLIRGIGGVPADLASGATFTLSAGDILVTGANAHYQLKHAAGPPANVVSFNLFTNDFFNGACPGSLGTTAKIAQLGSASETPASLPQHLVARRIVLDPGETYDAPKVAGQIVVLAREDPSVVFGVSGTHAVNTTDKPVSLLAMTLDPIGNAATPIASPTS